MPRGCNTCADICTGASSVIRGMISSPVARPQDLLPRRLLRRHDLGGAVRRVLSRRHRSPTSTCVPVGMIHRDGNPFEGVPLDADDHACVDFRFCADPKMRWWFDHHPTAFQPPRAARDLRSRARADLVLRSDRAVVRGLDRAHSSRPAGTGSRRAHLADAVAWADKIDAARFASRRGGGRARRRRRSASPRGSRTADRRLDTARYVEWLSRELARRGRARGPSSRRSSPRSRTSARASSRRSSGSACGTATSIVFDRFDDVGARNPGFLGYLLFPSCAVRGRRHAHARRASRSPSA